MGEARKRLRAIETEAERAQEHRRFMAFTHEELQQTLDHDIGFRAWLVEVQHDIGRNDERAKQKLARIISVLTVLAVMVPG